MKAKRGYTLIEMLVYIAVLAVVIDLSFAAYYRYDLYTRNLRRNADDIVRVMRAGERWRDDVRNATAPPHAIDNGIAIPQRSGEVDYVFADGIVSRQAAGSGTILLRNAKISTMSLDPRQHVSPWRWELELTSPKKIVLVRPLFTFTAVAGRPL
jgi:prepilin-type N-terminal cleavage/methylation domain-containing protein